MDQRNLTLCLTMILPAFNFNLKNLLNSKNNFRKYEIIPQTGRAKRKILEAKPENLGAKSENQKQKGDNF